MTNCKHTSKLYPNLFTRIGKIRNAKVRAEFFENLRPIQQKGRRVPISLQDKVDKEIHRLMNEGHIVKLQECSDKYFVSPIVITVKKDGSIKLALESRELNKQVHKNKYQMPNIDELVDGVSQIIAEKKSGNVYFTTLDFTYAYGQVALEQKTSEQCNFSLVGGKSTGTYCFKNGFYGLTSMPAEFQKVIDNLIKEFPQANAFIDDILIASKGTKIEHIALVEKILKKLDVSNVALKLRICENRVRMARISKWGKWYHALSKKNTSNRRLENPKFSKAVEISNGFTTQFTQIFTQTRRIKRTVKATTESK